MSNQSSDSLKTAYKVLGVAILLTAVFMGLFYVMMKTEPEYLKTPERISQPMPTAIQSDPAQLAEATASGHTMNHGH